MKMTAVRSLGILLLALVCQGAWAQTNPNEYVEEKPVLMKNEATGAFIFHSSGLGIQFRRGFNLTGYKKWIFESEFVSMKHPKEIKTLNPYFDNAKSYVYGKLNIFDILRVGTGIQRTLYSKAERHGVEIRMLYSGGLDIGMTKPVYLNILKPTGRPGEFDVTVEKYDPAIHNVDDIYGRAPYTTGMDEMKFHPGAYAKLGFNFEYAPIFEDVKSLEIGAMLDAFPKKIPIMALTENKQFFLTFYITVMYGRKW